MVSTDVKLYNKDYVTGSPICRLYFLEQHTLTYNMNGDGSQIDQATFFMNDFDITPASPTAEGYTFGGWYDNADCTGNPITTVPTGTTSNVAVYAKWTLNDYTPIPTPTPTTETNDSSEPNVTVSLGPVVVQNGEVMIAGRFYSLCTPPEPLQRKYCKSSKRLL